MTGNNFESDLGHIFNLAEKYDFVKEKNRLYFSIFCSSLWFKFKRLWVFDWKSIFWKRWNF